MQIGDFWISEFEANLEISNLQFRISNLLFLATHLNFETLGILNVEAALGGADLQPAALQLGFNGRLHTFVGVPVLDRVGNVIDLLRGRPVPNNKNVVAERQAALHAVISRHLHSE